MVHYACPGPKPDPIFPGACDKKTAHEAHQRTEIVACPGVPDEKYCAICFKPMLLPKYTPYPHIAHGSCLIAEKHRQAKK